MATNEERAIKILFVCSMNQWRSPTGESIYSDRPLVTARSTGTNKKARKRVTSNDLKWADIVFVMEQKQKQRLTAEYPGEMRFQEVHVLDIPDECQYTVFSICLVFATFYQSTVVILVGVVVLGSGLWWSLAQYSRKCPYCKSYVVNQAMKIPNFCSECGISFDKPLPKET